jgi:hypothetical protein
MRFNNSNITGLSPRIIFTLLTILLVVGCKKQHDNSPVTLASLSTTYISSITSTSATSGGSIMYDGEASITAKGVCYSTTAHPTIADKVMYAGSGTAEFTCTIKGLLPNTTYYVRAFATNSAGTAYGTNELFFNTTLATPSITTVSTSSVSGNDAVCGGNVTDYGGTSILERGLCYSKNPNPTVADSVVFSLSGTDSFSVNLTGLTSNTIYYIRAYAKSSAGVGYGNEISFTTLMQVIAIGQNYNGGIIFYIDDTGRHGLIAATTDQSTSADWGCYGSAIAGAAGFAPGDGAQNTLDMVTGCGTVGSAAVICSNLVLGGYNDWVLPSKGDFSYMYQNLYLHGLCNFSTRSYWSSTQVDGSNASDFNFSTNTSSNSNKSSPYSVRAIRSF